MEAVKRITINSVQPVFTWGHTKKEQGQEIASKT